MLKEKQKKLWFRAKCFGWGWYPCSWEGWLVLLAWVVLFAFMIAKINYGALENFIFILISVLILIWICYKTGEKPRWRWGCKRK